MDRAARNRYGGANIERLVRLIVVALIFAVGAIVSRVLLASVPARFILDLAQPLPVVTWWGSTGALFIGILLTTIAVASVAYAWSLQREPPNVRDTVIASAAALIAAFVWLPLFSSDVYAYAAYGEMARLGINPYVHVALPQTDPLFHAASWQWTGSLPICVYGTLFVSIATLVVFVTQHLHVASQLNAFRLLSCAASLCCVYLLAKCGAEGDDRRARRAALFLGLNPVALWAAAEGHNDTLMVALVLAGIVLYRTKHAAGAFVAVLAGAIKIPGLIAGGTLATVALLERGDRRAFAAGAAGVAVVAVASLPLIYGATHDLAPHGHYAPLASVQSLHPVVAIAVAIAVLLRARTAQTTIDRLASIALAAWLAIPNPYPWYGLWLLPLGAWASDRRIALTTALVCAAATLRYIPDAVALPGSAAALALGAAALSAYTPLLSRGIIARS